MIKRVNRFSQILCMFQIKEFQTLLNFGYFNFQQNIQEAAVNSIAPSFSSHNKKLPIPLNIRELIVEKTETS